MINLLALYRGNTLQDIKTVTVCTDPAVIKDFCRALLDSTGKDKSDDPSIRAIVDGQRKALLAIIEE